MAKSIKIISMVFTLFCLQALVVSAAPDPTEVKELKEKAPVHLVGQVIDDRLIEDTSKGEIRRQERKMVIQIEKVIKSPDDYKSKSIDVYYSYIPTWQAKEWVGPERMNIAMGDVIEIWLKKGDKGWESSLSGNTVNHISYANDRKEPIAEPFMHKLKRLSANFLSKYVEWIVFGSIFVLLVLIVYVAKRNKNKFNYS